LTSSIFFGGKLGNTWFFPVSKCLFSFFSKDLQLSEILKIWRKQKKKKNTASKTYGHCDRNPITLFRVWGLLLYGSFFFLDVGPSILFLVFPFFLGVLWLIYGEHEFHQKHWKSEEQKQTLNPKPGCFR
jgi:hypothetical protein